MVDSVIQNQRLLHSNDDVFGSRVGGGANEVIALGQMHPRVLTVLHRQKRMRHRNDGLLLLLPWRLRLRQSKQRMPTWRKRDGMRVVMMLLMMGRMVMMMSQDGVLRLSRMLHQLGVSDDASRRCHRHVRRARRKRVRGAA